MNPAMVLPPPPPLMPPAPVATVAHTLQEPPAEEHDSAPPEALFNATTLAQDSAGVVQQPTTEAEVLECMFCRTALTQEGAEFETEGLSCGHTFHKSCLKRCKEVKKKRGVEW